MADLVERVADLLRDMRWSADAPEQAARAIIPLIEADMKERCAEVAEADHAPAYGDPYLEGQNVAGKRIAAAVRSMKGTLDD